jgi:transketolase
MTEANLEQRGIATIRGLAMDGPHKARSGHQGTAMALAPLAHVLWTRIMKYDPTRPDWPDRDRFVLSAGHASILQYAMLHLTGYDLSLDDLKEFRQWASLTPGHPEVGHTAGIEVTTGPLGQGFGNAVGMGIAERWLRSRYGAERCNHHTYVICGDGDLAEGLSHEAASMAGHLGLGRLIYVYDDNHISIDGATETWLSDNAPERFKAYGWHVEDLGESGEDLDAIEAALRGASAVEDAPSLVVLRSHIANPSPDALDSPAAHGYALFDDEIARTKELMGLPPDETFHVPADVLDFYREAGRRGLAEREAWETRIVQMTDDRAEYEAALSGTGLADWQAKLPTWEPGTSVATRKSSAACLAAMVEGVPGLVAGGADLTGNTGTKLADSEQLTAESPDGRQIFFGVREHAMGAAMLGMALHGGMLPVGGTFLVFSDYMRPAIRLAALSGGKVIYSFTHDSVGVGEDGPTHQPVEQIAALRAIPGLTLIRPADANETAEAWKIALDIPGPVAMILTRQNVPTLEGTGSGLSRGAYVVLSESGDAPDVVIIGTGSEVALCVEAAADLLGQGISARVVSLPSWELFEAAGKEYRTTVLPPDVPAVSVEAGISLGWAEYADASVAIDRFGASAPGDIVFDKLGINVANICATVKSTIDSNERTEP